MFVKCGVCWSLMAAWQGVWLVGWLVAWQAGSWLAGWLAGHQLAGLTAYVLQQMLVCALATLIVHGVNQLLT